MKRAAPKAAPAGPCPCGGQPAGRGYDDCCGRFHRGAAIPATAEQLMRSRYSAYALRNADWLRATWAPENCPAAFGFDDPQPGPPTHWLGLKIVAHLPHDDRHAEVEFIARYKTGGRAQRLHERSRFERREGRWLYVDGLML